MIVWLTLEVKKKKKKERNDGGTYQWPTERKVGRSIASCERVKKEDFIFIFIRLDEIDDRGEQVGCVIGISEDMSNKNKAKDKKKAVVVMCVIWSKRR